MYSRLHEDESIAMPEITMNILFGVFDFEAETNVKGYGKTLIDFKPL